LALKQSDGLDGWFPGQEKMARNRESMNRRQRRAARKPAPAGSAGVSTMFAEALRLHRAGALPEAEWLYRQILSINPDHADSLHLLGVISHQRGRYAVAAEMIGKAIATDPKAASYHSNLGASLRELGRLDEANACWRKAVALDPRYWEARHNLGTGLWGRGRFEEAFAVHQATLRLGGDRCFSYHGMSICRKFTETDRPLIAEMKQCLEDRRLSDKEPSKLHFALGKIFDDLGEPESAIQHFDEANRLERMKRRFDAREFSALIDRLICSFPRGTPRSPEAFESELPVLIVGMPRSGTTLVEQILTSHPKIAGCGELRFWLQRSAPILQRPFTDLSPTAELDIARDYLGLLTELAPGAERVTDKNPFNFLVLGLIQKTLPRARIIHCRRNPVDMALSIYFTSFGRANDFSYSRGDIVLYYREYRRLMQHWRAMLSADRFLEVDYEELVADQDRVSRNLINFVGLDWDDGCIEFHRIDRPIDSSSAWQVRQPIYRTSVERWRLYEPWLGEFRELLQEGQ
jgi:tetratricopeptide (TPR) repeat protein